MCNAGVENGDSGLLEKGKGVFSEWSLCDGVWELRLPASPAVLVAIPVFSAIRYLGTRVLLLLLAQRKRGSL